MTGFWINPLLGYPSSAGPRRVRTIERARRRAARRSSPPLGQTPSLGEGGALPTRERSSVYTTEQLREVIATVPWTQSKGYDRSSDGAHVAPHQYIVRQREPEAYAALRWAIEHREETYRASYGGYRYTYWPFDGWRYWCMGVILNRVPIEDAQADPLASDDPDAVDFLTGQRGT